MIYENRIYTAVPGKLGAINDRFANITIDYFNQYDIGMMGFWTDEIGISNQM
ncbi:MAG TPA: NIPSNAP family protein, partial [Dehalococcoidia bacterium]|nr:NIPSNAP family protein [Dehalococcoidia bacterium]